MNIFKRIYNWLTTELQLIYEDFSEGYVDSQEDLMDIVTENVQEFTWMDVDCSGLVYV